MSKVRLAVYERSGKHYASRYFPNSTPSLFPDAIFNVEGNVDSNDALKQLEEEARQKARQHGIAHVINLD